MTTETELPDARAQAVQRAIDAWVRKLVDFSARNNLLYFRDLKAGTLAFDAAEPGQVERLLAGETVSLPRLAPAETDTDAARISRAMLGIWRRSLANHEERGLQTLFLAVGMATWDDSKTNRDGTEARPPLAPVLLYPIAVERAGREGQSFNLRLAGEPQINLVLLLAIRDPRNGRCPGCAAQPSQPSNCTSKSRTRSRCESAGDEPGLQCHPMRPRLSTPSQPWPSSIPP